MDTVHAGPILKVFLKNKCGREVTEWLSQSGPDQVNMQKS